MDEAVWRNIKGYCISCGYLGKRSLYYDEVYEASDHDRTYFSFVSNKSPLPQHSGTLPCCFVNELPLSKEFRDLEEKYQRAKDNSEISMEITTRDIKCPKWTPYQSFKTPKEHYEEFKMWELEQRREEFEQRMEKERKEFDLKLAEMSQQVQKDSARVVAKADKFNRRITWFFIALATLEVVGTFLSLAFPNGIQWLVNLFH